MKCAWRSRCQHVVEIRHDKPATAAYTLTPLLAVTLIVIVIAQKSGSDACSLGICGGEAMTSAFQQAAQRVLGGDARIQAQLATDDPADEASSAKGAELDGVVELSFTSDGQKARLHCYVSREKRWLDREISFGESRGSLSSEVSERGRLLGFAVATMYAGDSEKQPAPALSPPQPAQTPARSAAKSERVAQKDVTARPQAIVARRSVEFAGIASSGLHGNAAGLGASAALRLRLTGPMWARLSLAGRSGNIPQAQANTRTALIGGGVALALLPQASAFELGARLDTFASYFNASHLSEDDITPDSRSRWLLGGDLLAEVGFRITGGAGAFFGVGLEGMLGKTEIYTHQRLAAVVPPFRAVAELGFRTQF